MNTKCVVCSHEKELIFRLKYNVYKCPSCGLHSSDATFDFSFQSNLEEENREIGLKNLRFGNFDKIIKKAINLFRNDISQIKGLEIGSGNGWWLKACQENKIKCIGVEPENTFIEYYNNNHLNVISGFYPNSTVSSKDGYDFIIFNDVFEHISDLENLITSLKKDLKKNGLLIINLPISNGFFYKIATFFYYLNINSLLERLWQFNFHSPHINYFNQQNLSTLVRKSGFEMLDDFRLETLDFSSIKERIMADNKIGSFRAYILTKIILLINPIIKYSSPDIKVFFFQSK